MNELQHNNKPHITVKDLITENVQPDNRISDELGHWRSTYAQSYHYDDPNAFCKPMVYTELPCVQNPGSKCVDSYKFLPGYIPRLMYCRPPGIIKPAPQALGLGTFNRVKLDNNLKMKPIQRGVAPNLRRKQAFKPEYRHLDSHMTQEEESKFNYHNLVKPGRYEGLKLSTGTDLTVQKLNNSDAEKLQSIIHPAAWTTSLERSNLQASIPIKHKRKVHSEIEKNSDTVRYKAARYNAASEPWQKFSDKWDRVQARENVVISSCHEDMKAPDSAANHSNLEADDSMRDENNNVLAKNSSDHKINLANCSENRQVPGYSGYVPRLPIIKRSCSVIESREPTKKYNYTNPTNTQLISNDRPDTVSDFNRTTTSMQRSFPKYELANTISPYARKSHMSNMVTLVAPNNPFRLSKNEKGSAGNFGGNRSSDYFANLTS